MRLSYILTAGILFGGIVCAEPVRVAAEEAKAASVVSLGLRSGYDSNPADLPDARASAFIGHTLTWDYAVADAQKGVAVKLVSVGTFFDPRVLAASASNRASVAPSLTLAQGLVLRGALEGAQDQSWSRRQTGLTAKLRLDFERDGLRLFGTGEARVGALNERNYFALGSFLPSDENSATVAILPGIAYKGPLGEVGTSIRIARVNYLEPADYIGLRRDNERVQPNVFGELRLGPAQLEGSVSLLRVRFPAKDFYDLTRLLWSAKVSVPFGWFTLTIASARAAEETTLPFTVVNLSDLHEARVSFDWTERDRIALAIRQKSDNYLGLSARETSRAVNLEYTRRLAEGLAMNAAIGVRRVRETGAEIPDALTVSIGLQKQLSVGL